MIKNSVFKILAPAAVMAVTIIHTYADDVVDSIQISKPTMTMYQEVTHVIHGGQYINNLGGLNHAWIEPTGGSIDFQATKNERLALEVMVAATYYAAPWHNDLPQNFTRNITVSTPRLDASYVFGDVQHPFLKIDAGIFNYKYNEYSRNLGEYMFRSWAYPGIIFTGGTFNYSGANSATVTGLRLSQSLGMFSHELIASIETELTPVYDLNLTYMAKFNYKNMFKVGGGVQLARVFSADDDPVMTTKYFQENGKWYVSGSTGSSYYGSIIQDYKNKIMADSAKFSAPGATAADSAAINADISRLTTDMAGPQDDFLVVDSVSLGQLHPKMKDLTAEAIKPVLYFSFDPKPLFESSIFGAKDLVVYGEAAILGVQNYPVYYDDITRRIPMMIGFNFPAFKLLDVLSLEMEYYGSRWEPTFDVPQNLNAKPAPFMALTAYDAKDWDKDNLKWSVYAERTLVRGLIISGQMASDHSRSWDWAVFGKTPWEIYTRPSQFYWSLKLGVKI